MCADIYLLCNTAKDHDAIRDEARELLQQVQGKSVEYDPDRKVCHVRFLFTPRSQQCRTPPYACLLRRIHSPHFTIP